MKEFYVYVFQINIGLLIFYLFYRILFAGDTFLRIRRLFLITSIGLAFVYPLLSIPELAREEIPLQVLMVNYAAMVDTAAAVVVSPEEISTFIWQDVVGWIWGGGVLFFLARMMLQLFILCRLAYKGKKAYWKEQKIIVSETERMPFSFFHWIFVNPASHSEKELSEVMAHEQAHVRQGHSYDMLLSEFLRIVFWFNPIVWLLRKEIRQNLEFLADQSVVDAGWNRKSYQYHLVRLSCQSTIIPIVNNFNVSSLKKRIVMMNKKQTPRMSLLKYTLLLPVTGLLILSANAHAVTNVIEKTFSVAQQGEVAVKGVVKDENGKPLPEVSVIVKNTSVGTVTDNNGCYEIKVPENSVLCFSYVGKKTLELPVAKGAKTMNVGLIRDNVQLEDEVVVTAYGFSKSKDNRSNNEPVVEGYASNKKEPVVNAYMKVEEMPEFATGTWQQYVVKHIKYPAEAQKKGTEGKVQVTFVISKEGKVMHPQVVKGVDPLLDAEALRIVKSMPDWKPGRQRGHTVDVQLTLPIVFRLTGQE